jgi:hypothetical protein
VRQKRDEGVVPEGKKLETKIFGQLARQHFDKDVRRILFGLIALAEMTSPYQICQEGCSRFSFF